MNKFIDMNVGPNAETYGNLWKQGKGFCIAETVQKLSTSGFS